MMYIIRLLYTLYKAIKMIIYNNNPYFIYINKKIDKCIF